MPRIADKLLTRIAGKATVAASCTTTTYCISNHIVYRTCCLNQGCTDRRTGNICHW
ncbi:hypothetical protein [Actinomadura decatromicini]|uniref:hypothetical protein n=1 Tax=Actinomadura decatromicini TaxID=2604572 RepID=UPI001653010B|nr:hypothetical protein [Actinomadura decatromicini]